MFCKVKSTNGLFLSDAVGVYHSNIVKIIKYWLYILIYN